MKQKKIRTSDIAKLAGVSPATISRVLNHRELVKPETVAIVEHAMQELGLSLPPSVSEKKNRKEVILVNCPQGTNPFYEEVISGVITSATAHGFYTLLNYSPLNRGTIEDFLELIHKIKASGVITMSLLSTELLKTITKEVPLVQCCEYNKDSDCPYVSVDDFTAAENAVRYLISCGRNKIAILNGPSQYKYAKERLAGFQKAMEAAQLFVPSSWIVNVPEINYTMAYSIVTQLLASENRPNAMFAASDVLAAAIINAAKHYRIRIPHDLMVIGFDNIDLCQITRPTITSFNQPKQQLGFTACEILVENILSSGLSPHSMILSTELVIRESTAGTPSKRDTARFASDARYE